MATLFSTWLHVFVSDWSKNTSLAALGALAHDLQHRTACNAAPPATPHRLQRRTACNAALPATPHCLQQVLYYHYFTRIYSLYLL